MIIFQKEFQLRQLTFRQYLICYNEMRQAFIKIYRHITFRGEIVKV